METKQSEVTIAITASGDLVVMQCAEYGTVFVSCTDCDCEQDDTCLGCPRYEGWNNV